MAETLLRKYLGHMFGHASDRVIVMDDGSLFAMIEVGGVPLTGASRHADVNAWRDSFNETVKNCGSPGRLTLSVIDTRGPAQPNSCPPGLFRTALAARFDAQYRSRLFEQDLLWQNRLCVGIHLRPREPLGQTAAAKLRAFRRKMGQEPDPSDELLHDIEELCGRLMVELGPARPRRLTMVTRDGGLYCEIKEFIAYAMTNVARQVPVTTGRVGSDILCETVTVGREAILIRGPGHTRFVACFSMQHYPTKTNPMRARVFQTSTYPRTLVHVFCALDDGSALTQVSRKQNIMVAAGDPAFEQIAGLTLVKNDLQAKKFTFGSHSFVMTVFADDADALDPVCDVAWHDLVKYGATGIRERDALPAAYFSMVPAKSHLQVRPGSISSRNFVSMAPLHGIDEGSSIGHWGAPICIFRSSAGTPVFFHWHLMDVGNVLITGETGAGKTLLTSTLLSATIGRARIFAFDHKRGWEAMIRGNGGRYAILGSGTPSFAPLKALGNNPCDIEFLLDLLRCCIQTGGWRELTAEEDRRLILAVNTVMTFPPEHRSIGEVRAFLGAAREGAGARLERWCAGGELGWVLDADTDLITLDGDLYGFDTTNLLGNKTAAAPAMLYLFYQVRLRLDGTPILLPLDEGWSVLADPTFGPAVGRQLRTIRSKNGAVAFITQSPADAVKSGFAASIIQQCPTQIHGANTRITREDFVTALSRTDEEFDVVSHLPLQRGLFLLCRGRDSQVIELNLAGMSDEIAMLSTREEDHWAVDRAVAEAGDDPEAFLALYHRYRKLKRQEALAA